MKNNLPKKSSMVSRVDAQKAYDNTCAEGRKMLEDIFPFWFGDEDITQKVEFRLEYLTGRHYIRLYYKGKQIGFYQNYHKGLSYSRVPAKVVKGGFVILHDLKGIFKIVPTSEHGFKIMRKPG